MNFRASAYSKPRISVEERDIAQGFFAVSSGYPGIFQSIVGLSASAWRSSEPFCPLHCAFFNFFFYFYSCLV